MTADVARLLRNVPKSVTSRFYGCGSPIPPLLSGLEVLDLGCGTGRDTYVVAQLVGEGGRAVGVDMTAEQLEVAQAAEAEAARAFGFAKPNTFFVEGDISNLRRAGIANASVDVVISNCVLNLAANKEAVLLEVARVLKPGGELYFSCVKEERGWGWGGGGGEGGWARATRARVSSPPLTHPVQHTHPSPLPPLFFPQRRLRVPPGPRPPPAGQGPVGRVPLGRPLPRRLCPHPPPRRPRVLLRRHLPRPLRRRPRDCQEDQGHHLLQRDGARHQGPRCVGGGGGGGGGGWGGGGARGAAGRGLRPVRDVRRHHSGLPARLLPRTGGRRRRGGARRLHHGREDARGRGDGRGPRGVEVRPRVPHHGAEGPPGAVWGGRGRGGGGAACRRTLRGGDGGGSGAADWGGFMVATAAPECAPHPDIEGTLSALLPLSSLLVSASRPRSGGG